MIYIMRLNIFDKQQRNLNNDKTFKRNRAKLHGRRKKRKGKNVDYETFRNTNWTVRSNNNNNDERNEPKSKVLRKTKERNKIRNIRF